MLKKWTEEEHEFLRVHYPEKGRAWCAQQLGKRESQVRMKTARLGLKQNRDSEFFKDWQARAAASKVGKKRPEQAAVILRLHLEGRLAFTEERRRATGERIKEHIKKHGHPRGALGIKHDEQTRRKIGAKSREHWERMTEEQRHEKLLKTLKTRAKNGTLVNPRPKASWKAGWREIGGKRKYFRSRWEANYARYLEWLKSLNQIREWEHEAKTFWFDKIKRGCVSYLPDFYVINRDGSECYHEVKGWMDDRSKTKLKRMAIYYPEVTIVLIRAKDYEQIEKSSSKFILDWEHKNA